MNPFLQRPKVNPIVAYRSWRILPEFISQYNPRLAALTVPWSYAGAIWQPGQNEAVCLRSPIMVTCACGLYSVSNLATALELAKYETDPTVTGLVLNWGRIVVGDAREKPPWPLSICLAPARQYRSEFSRVIALLRPNKFNRVTYRVQWPSVEQLAATYDVPLFKTKWGLAGYAVKFQDKIDREVERWRARS